MISSINNSTWIHHYCPNWRLACNVQVLKIHVLRLWENNENLGAKRDGNFSSQNATYQVPLREKGILPCVISNRCPMLKVLGDIDHHRQACMYVYCIGMDRQMIFETRCHNKLQLINIRGTETSLQLVLCLPFHPIPSVHMRPSAEKAWFSNSHCEILILQRALGLCRDGQTRMSTVDMVKPECRDGQTPDCIG